MLHCFVWSPVNGINLNTATVRKEGPWGGTGIQTFKMRTLASGI